MKFSIPHIAFEITKECNLECKYCYNPWRRYKTKIPKYSFSKAKKTLKQIFRKFNFKYLSFTGGEPFLADGLCELVLYSRMHNKNTLMISNGTAGTKKKYDHLYNFGVSMFEFPLLSYRETIHDSLTCRPGSFIKSRDSITYLINKNIPVVAVFVITKINHKDLQKTLKLANELGVKRFMLARFNIGGRGIQYAKELLLSKDELNRVFYNANQFSSNIDMKITSNVCVPHCIIEPRDYPNLQISSCPPHAEKRPITIDFEGNVRMCNHSPIPMGNIFSDNIIDMFDSSYTKNWENVQPEFCTECKKWEKCRGGCRAASEQLGYSLEVPDPILL